MVIKGTLKCKEYPLNHPAKRRLLGPSTVLVGGTVYIHGGLGSTRYPFYRVSLATRKWQKLPNLEYRLSHSNVLVDDKIYVFGGWRNARTNLRIEAYDLVTNTVETFDQCKGRLQRVAYVASRREVIIVGATSANFTAVLFGFNVGTGRISPYRNTSGVVPLASKYASFVQAGHRLCYCRNSGKAIFMLTLGLGHTAAWTEIELRGQFLSRTVNYTVQVVHGLLFIFGGHTDQTLEELEDYIVLVDPLTVETVQVGPTSGQENVRFEGKWPEPPLEAGVVASNGKLWIFGGKLSSKIVELEFERKM